MSRYFMPVVDESPLILSIKGHEFVILSSANESFFWNFFNEIDSEIGRVELCEIDIVSENISTDLLSDNPERIDSMSALASGMIIVPEGVDVWEMLDKLEQDLPWLQ